MQQEETPNEQMTENKSDTSTYVRPIRIYNLLQITDD